MSGKEAQLAVVLPAAPAVAPGSTARHP